MITPDQLLSGRKFRDVDVVTVTPTSLSARVDGKLVEVDLEAKPALCAEVQAIAPGAKRLRIAQASLESVRSAELNPTQTEAWLVVADPKPDAKVVGFAAPASLLTAMPRTVQRKYASGLTADEIAAWPNLCALIDEATGDGDQSSSRNGASVDALQTHHSTMLSARAYVQLVQGLLRQVSSNLAIDVDGRIIRVVNLLRRAWTSGSASFDARAITVETANATLAPNYTLSEAAKVALGRVAAAIKLDRAIQTLTTNNVYLHREMLPRWGVSYGTACPMDITAAEIIRRANSGALIEPEPLTLEDHMYTAFVPEVGDVLITSTYVRKLVDQPTVKSKDAITAVEKLSGRNKIVLPFPELWALWVNINAGTKDDSATGTEIKAIAKKLGITS